MKAAPFTMPIYPARRTSRLLIISLIFIAFTLRVWRLDSFPPGWRDDELINSLVISQKALDGDLAPYYADASGHEALYHVLNAVPLGLFGPGALGIRLLSAFLGTLAIPMTYVVSKRLAGPASGLLAAAALTVSFWSLMYSRIGLRHVLTPFLTLVAFHFFWQGVQAAVDSHGQSKQLRSWLLSALAMALGFYTYFASRGVPLIIIAFGGYLLLFDRTLFKRIWRGIALSLTAAAVLTLPLLITLWQQPASEARVSELAVPLVEAREGNLAPLWDHVRITLNMFHSDGDNEWLYNVPNRPLFDPIGALLFWLGVAIALWYALQPMLRRKRKVIGAPLESRSLQSTQMERAGAFLLLWWLAGISPGFFSVPPASLGHTIVAQPAVYILIALPWKTLYERLSSIKAFSLRYIGAAVPLAALLLVGSIGWRDLTAYYQDWPERGMVRFLYRADIRNVAEFLNQNPDIVDFSISGLLAGPWDKLSLLIDLKDSRADSVRPRWFDPRRAALLEPSLSFYGFPDVSMSYAGYFTPVPGTDQIGGYRLSQVAQEAITSEEICFANGLCNVSAAYLSDSQETNNGVLELIWRVREKLELPEVPLISNPPPPGVYSGPRLLIFGQLHDENGQFLAGDDGLWVDPYSLQPGDVFIQMHQLPVAGGARPASAVFGLYDPMTGERILTEDGRDQVQMELKD